MASALLCGAFASATSVEVTCGVSGALRADREQRDLGIVPLIRDLVQHRPSSDEGCRSADKESGRIVAGAVGWGMPHSDHTSAKSSIDQALSLRIRNGWTKWMLRKAMEDTVPRETAWRRDKVGFETPENAWLVQWMGTEPDFFETDSLSGRYLDLATVRSKISSWIGKDGRAPQLPVLRWINLELWLNRFSQVTSESEERAD
jgi:hypothetical protein